MLGTSSDGAVVPGCTTHPSRCHRIVADGFFQNGVLHACTEMRTLAVYFLLKYAEYFFRRHKSKEVLSKSYTQGLMFCLHN